MKQPLKYQFEKPHPNLTEHPIRLNLAEIENPISVIQDFFVQYGLKHTRIYLDELISDAIENSGVDYANYRTIIYSDLEKVIEAAFLLRYLEEEEDIITKVNKSSIEKQKHDHIESNEPVYIKYYKDQSYLDSIYEDPMFCIANLFQNFGDDSLKIILKEWMMLAISSQHSEEYTEKIEIANLIVFCESLQKVIEALYLLSVAYLEDINTKILELNNSCIFLTEEEQNNPYVVLKAFRKEFPNIHVEAEMWDIFHSIVSYKKHEEIKRHELVDTFKDLFCISKAPYLILKEDENLLTVLKKLNTEQKNQIAKNNF